MAVKNNKSQHKKFLDFRYEINMNYLYIFAICVAAYATVHFVENLYDINHKTKKNK